MTYELAKELKEAGFPQENSDYSYRDSTKFGRGVEIQQEDSATGEFLCSIPDLSELIEACGDVFDYLCKNGESGNNNSWEAIGNYYCCDEHGDGKKFGYGISPEEAVAKLWLALNKK